jgi:hypothetical protein
MWRKFMLERVQLERFNELSESSSLSSEVADETEEKGYFLLRNLIVFPDIRSLVSSMPTTGQDIDYVWRPGEMSITDACKYSSPENLPKYLKRLSDSENDFPCVSIRFNRPQVKRYRDLKDHLKFYRQKPIESPNPLSLWVLRKFYIHTANAPFYDLRDEHNDPLRLRPQGFKQLCGIFPAFIF